MQTLLKEIVWALFYIYYKFMKYEFVLKNYFRCLYFATNLKLTKIIRSSFRHNMMNVQEFLYHRKIIKQNSLISSNDRKIYSFIKCKFIDNVVQILFTPLCINRCILNHVVWNHGIVEKTIQNKLFWLEINHWKIISSKTHFTTHRVIKFNYNLIWTK